MKIYIKYLFLLLLLLVSCEKKVWPNYEKLLLGDWIFEKENPIKKNMFYTDFGFSFTENGICDCKPGYYERKEIKNNTERRTIFYGTKTTYKIEDDSLYIKNLITHKWDASKIVSVTAHTLKLCQDANTTLEFSKQQYATSDKDDFDKIIISKSPCFGSCPINDIEISSKGDIIYSGGYYNLKNGFFKAKVTPQTFQEIETNFKKTNFLSLKNEYAASWTDDQEVTVTFIKNNTILKTIRDYGRQSPKFFRITLDPITFLYQKLKLTEIKDLKAYQENRYYAFEKGNKIIRLNNSEEFYLSNLLKEAKPSTKAFKPTYTKSYHSDYMINKLETDGQLYRFYLKDKSSVTLDLGFNFIAINNLEKRLETKNEYD